MLARDQILKLFEKLNSKLARHDSKGEIGLVGGAVMCLVYQARQATKDVDAIFEPSSVIRKAAQEIAKEEGLAEDWLDDGAKGFLVGDFERQPVLALSHLTVWAPEPQYMLAMKCISARVDTHDADDIRTLIQTLQLTRLEQVLDVVGKYYPKGRIPARTSYFIEEVLEGGE